MSKIWYVFWWILIDFGSVLGPKLDACWDHVGHKNFKKATSNKAKQNTLQQGGRREPGRNGDGSWGSLILQKTTFNAGIQGENSRPHS